jgi:hypothetical protein
MMQQYLVYNREERVYETLPVRSASGYHHIHGEEEAWGDECGSTHEEAGEGRAEKPKRGMPEDGKSDRRDLAGEICKWLPPHSW